MSDIVNQPKDHSNADEEPNADAEVVDYDRLLCAAGELGLYQVFLFFSTCPFYVFGVFNYMSQIFITQPANHWCWIPELANLTDVERINLAIPKDDSQFGYAQCKSYVANWSEVLAIGMKPNYTWPVSACTDGWEFNTTEIPYPTISSEMNWVCDKGSYQTAAQSFYFVGSVLGGFVVGWVADRFGRLPAAVFSNLVGCVAGTASMFSRNFTEFSICRFFMGMSYDNCMMMVYLLVLEYISPRYKTVISNLAFASFFMSAAVALPFVALASAHWKTLILATSLPMSLAILAPLIIPESPRWLLSKGRTDDAVNKILTIARVNKKTIPPKLIERFKQHAPKTVTESVSFVELLKRPYLRKVLVCICLLFLCLDIVLDSLIWSIAQLPFDFFVSFAIISFTEFPSVALLSFTLDKVGRRCMFVVTMAVCAVASYSIPAVGAGVPSVACAMVARFAVNMSYNVCMQWAAELFPTCVRGSGTSMAHTWGYIGAFISPFVSHLNIVQFWLPMAVVGSLALFAAAVSLILPETAGRPMPQTFEDAEELINNQKILDLPCFRKRSDKKTGVINQTFEMN